MLSPARAGRVRGLFRAFHTMPESGFWNGRTLTATRAKPGALGCEPLEAARRGALTRPAGYAPPPVAPLPQSHLLQALILFFLLPKVFPYDFFIASRRGHIESSRTEVLPDKVLLPLSIHLRHMNRAFSLDISHYLRHRVLGRYCHQHVHMVRQQVPFFDLTFLLPRQLPEDFSKAPS